MKKFTDLINEILPEIEEIFPWDVEAFLVDNADTLIVDIREENEFKLGKIQGSLHVPRGILESACDWGYDDTLPALAAARNQNIILVCRSGNRSALAAFTMKLMGYAKVKSLKMGLRGWNDDESELTNHKNEVVDFDDADELFASNVSAEQMQTAE